MIVQEIIDENMIRTYSDAGFYIHGGFPESNYVEAIDPIEMHRVYVETNIPIEDSEPILENENIESIFIDEEDN